MTVTIVNSGDTAQLTFSGSAGERVSLAVTNPTSGGLDYFTTVALVKPDGSTLASVNAKNGNFLDTTTLPVEGTYTVSVVPASGSTGSITLQLYDVPADDSGAITAGGSAVTVTATTPGQNAARTFVGSADERVSLAVTIPASGGLDYFTTVALVEPNGSTLASVTAKNGNFLDTTTLPVSGTYTIYVNPPAGSVGSLTLQLYDVPADDSGAITAGGSAVTVTATTPGQNAARTFVGSADERVSLAVTIPASGGLDYFTTVALVEPNGSTLASVTAKNGNFLDTTTLPVSGTYTIYVNPPAGSIGSLTLQLYDVPADETGSIGIGDAPETVTISVPGQNASRTFTGSQGQPLTLTIDNPSSGGLDYFTNVAILTPDGSTLASASAKSGNTLTATLPVDGGYTVYVNPPAGGSGSLTLTLNQSAAYQPPAQTYGTCTGAGVHALAPSSCTADPVNSLTGAFTDSFTDVTVPSPGVPFVFARSYTSADATAGRLGPGWADSLSASLAVQQNGDVVVHGEDGQELTYVQEADGSYVGPSGALSTLTAASGGYQLVRRDQTRYTFDGSGRLTSMIDANGEGVTVAYDSDGHLASATDSVGRVETFASNPDGTLQQVTLSDGRTVQFGYTSGRLTSVTGVDGKTTTYSYDGGGRLATIVDPLGHTVVSNVYDGNGRVSQQTDANGKTTTFAWDASTQTATITDPDNHVWKDVYANNVLVKQTDPNGHTTQFGHDLGLDTTSVAAPDGSQTSLTYDSNGNLLTATAPASLGSAQKTFTYDASNNVKTVTDAADHVTAYVYDANGNPTSVSLDGQQIASYSYNSAGQVLTATDGNNHTTTYAYNSAGNVVSVTDPLGNETTYSYDAAGNRLTKVDPLGNVTGGTPADYRTSYTYDAAGRLLTETDPLGHTTTNSYDDAGNLSSTTDANGHTTSYAYDNANHLLSITGPDPDGAGPLTAPVTSYSYDDAGNRLTETDPLGHVTSYGYDAANRLASVTTPAGNKTTYSYDTNGNLATVVDPRGNIAGANPADYTTSYSYDAAGRLLSSTDPLGHTTSYSYDAVGNQTSVTDANSHTTSYSYDGAGRVLTVTAPDGGITSYSYDAAGNALTRADANNHSTSYDYDADNRLIKLTGPDPDGAGPLTAPVTSYRYDADGSLISSTDPNGNATQTTGDGTTTRSYDHADRLTGIDYSDTTPDVSFSYDAVGNRTGMTDGAGSVSYSYDDLNRLTGVSRGNDTFSYGYDAAGNLTSRSYPGGQTTSYGYTADNLLATATTGANETSYSYDPAGNLTQTTLPAGNGYSETRDYDRAGRLVEVKNANASSVLSDFASILDPVGNPTEIDRSGTINSTTTYGYDANDRLTSVCFQASCPNSSDPSIGWSYDKVGNRLTQTRSGTSTNYSYNAADELTQAGSTSYSYDANGNELTAGTNSYSYDLANRLVSAHVGGATTSYSYDGDGNRLQAISGSSTTNYLWDTNAAGGAPQLALERNGAGTTIRSYSYGVRRVAMVSGGNSFYYHYDPLGSVTNLTSNAGASEWTYDYEPFGTVKTATQNDPNAPDNPMQFVGEMTDPTGLVYLRARQYDPNTGRLLAADPALTPTGASYGSQYTYTDNRPTLMVDPSGATFHPSAAAAIAVSTATSGVSASYGNRLLQGWDPCRAGCPSARLFGYSAFNWTHLFGEIRAGAAVGFHYRGEDGTLDRLRANQTGEVIKVIARGQGGVYAADVEVKAPGGNWIVKGPSSTFFPDSWSRAKILDETNRAVAQPYDIEIQGTRAVYEGVGGGVRIRVVFDIASGNMIAAYPLLDRFALMPAQDR